MDQKDIEKLLIIAPSVPRYDRYSGDLRLFSILEILSNSYEIIYLASEKLRKEHDKYLYSLNDMGIRVLDEDYSLIDVLRKNRFKAAILEFYLTAEFYLPRIKLLQPSCPVIIDTVDVHYHRLYLKYQVTKDESDLRKAKETKRRELNIYKKADLTITVTDEDASILKKDCTDLHLFTIPNIHNIVSNNVKSKNGLIFVGGFSHSPNLDAVLYFCNDVLPLIRKEIAHIKFTIVGSNPPEKIRALNNDFITVTGYVPSTTPYLQKSYISVAPLRYGAGMKGKIGEAMAQGLPVVTTSIGAQGMGLVNRKNAMIGDSPQDFAEAVIELYQNENLYKTIQQNAIDLINNNYTTVRVREKISSMMAEVEHLPLRRMSLSEKTYFFIDYVCDKFKKKFSYNL